MNKLIALLMVLAASAAGHAAMTGASRDLPLAVTPALFAVLPQMVDIGGGAGLVSQNLMANHLIDGLNVDPGSLQSLSASEGGLDGQVKTLADLKTLLKSPDAAQKAAARAGLSMASLKSLERSLDVLSPALGRIDNNHLPSAAGGQHLKFQRSMAAALEAEFTEANRAAKTMIGRSRSGIEPIQSSEVESFLLQRHVYLAADTRTELTEFWKELSAAHPNASGAAAVMSSGRKDFSHAAGIPSAEDAVEGQIKRDEGERTFGRDDREDKGSPSLADVFKAVKRQDDQEKSEMANLERAVQESPTVREINEINGSRGWNEFENREFRLHHVKNIRIEQPESIRYERKKSFWTGEEKLVPVENPAARLELPKLYVNNAYAGRLHGTGDLAAGKVQILLGAKTEPQTLVLTVSFTGGRLFIENLRLENQ